MILWVLPWIVWALVLAVLCFFIEVWYAWLIASATFYVSYIPAIWRSSLMLWKKVRTF